MSRWSWLWEQIRAESCDKIAFGLVLESELAVLLVRRPERALLAGHYDIPAGFVDPKLNVEQNIAQLLEKSLGISEGCCIDFLNGARYIWQGQVVFQVNWLVRVPSGTRLSPTWYENPQWVGVDRWLYYPLVPNVRAALVGVWFGVPYAPKVAQAVLRDGESKGVAQYRVHLLIRRFRGLSLLLLERGGRWKIPGFAFSPTDLDTLETRLKTAMRRLCGFRHLGVNSFLTFRDKKTSQGLRRDLVWVGDITGDDTPKLTHYEDHRWLSPSELTGFAMSELSQHAADRFFTRYRWDTIEVASLESKPEEVSASVARPIMG